MNLALWITTGLLAVVSLASGMIKAFIPVEKLAKQPGAKWVENASASFVKTIGVLEILAAIGLIVPALVNIAPIMVPVTAVCWMLLMIGAMITHLRLGEFKQVAFNLLYFAMAAFITWGRFGPESFT